MGRQWLHAKREVASLKKSKTTSKFVREISLAARQGADPALNARLAAALERARKESVSRDIIERAIQKGSGTGEGKDSLEHESVGCEMDTDIGLASDTDEQQRTFMMTASLKKALLEELDWVHPRLDLRIGLCSVRV
jgi:transcriptional/translational regulatory protein YebC/TACO1